MPAYLNKAAFANLTVCPSGYLDAIDLGTPGWVDAQLEHVSAWIDARLSKRYSVPFAEPYPIAVLGWLVRIVTVRCYIKRGVDATDEQFTTIRDDAVAAEAEVKEAADSQFGLFELPLRANTTQTGVTHSGPWGYSEQSPYAWADEQRRVGREEDRNGRGTFHG